MSKGIYSARYCSGIIEKLLQSPILEATFGGGEANVAVSLANYGLDAQFVSSLPDNDIADACIRELRGFGVNTTRIVRRSGASDILSGKRREPKAV